MKTTILKTGVLALLVSFASCSNDSDNLPENSEARNTKVSITDAPIDNAEVSGAFVTITDVKVDGTSINGFTKTTVDLMALQNGNKQLLGDLDLNVGTVSSVSLILDYAKDENGNSPGSYIKTSNGVKHQLQASTNEIKIFDEAEIYANNTNEIVVDFDLRKTIKDSEDANDQFDFVTDLELASGLRFVNTNDAGTVSGSVTDTNNTSEKIIVFAYKAGTYSESEMQGQGTSGVEFANATTSAMVSANSTYQLSFLEEGDYEIKFASYEDANDDGELEFKGMLSVEGALNLDMDKINVATDVNLDVSVVVNGIL